MSGGPADPKGPRGGAGRGDEALKRAQFALSNRRPQEAEWIAGELLKTNPQHAGALRILGYALLMQGRSNDAIATLEPAARKLHDPEIETELALALRQAGLDNDALTRLERAVKRKPPFAPAFYELGSLLSLLDRHDEAIMALNRGIEVAPNMSELSIQLGFSYLAQRDYAGAKRAFARAITLAPHVAGALWGLGKALQATGENKAAIDYFRRCLILTPNDVGTLLNLGHSLLAVGDREAGYECLRRAARGDAKRHAGALSTIVKSGRGRFWLRPSAATKFFRSENG